MQLRRFMRHPIALLGIAALFAAGCILSGQFTFVLLIEDAIADVDQEFNAEHIDLTDDPTWDEHKDEIQNIIDVKFEMTIENETSSAVTGEVYVSETEYNNATDVRDNAILVISGIVVDPGPARFISFQESAEFISNLQQLLDLVESGEFYVYGLAADPPYEITIQAGARLMITFSAG